MGVYIRGLDEPKSCEDCELAMHFDGYNENDCPFNAFSFYDCPLVPVPPHGRLIDADAFIATIRPLCEEDDFAACTFATVKRLMIEHISEAPTIIPAEEVTK